MVRIIFLLSQTILKTMSIPFCAIASAHYKGGPAEMNIAQILHLSNFFELKRTLVNIFIYNSEPEKC
jgi:hypothetical protein